MALQRELQGLIHSGGYLCGCTACNFTKVSVLFAIVIYGFVVLCDLTIVIFCYVKRF